MTASLHRQVRQPRGVSLIFALVTLVALSLAAVALIRAVDTGTLVLGNLSFKQDTRLAADDAARQAIKWLNDNVATPLVQTDQAPSGYYATTRDTAANPLDPTGNSTNAARVVIDWDGGSAACSAYSSGSYSTCLRSAAVPTAIRGGDITARYVILRLCDGTGDPSLAAINCAKPLSVGAGDSGERGSFNYANAQRINVSSVAQYFRVLVRAQGARKTVTYTETLVHF
jgi:Tfp pilus assembly protein PilX